MKMNGTHVHAVYEKMMTPILFNPVYYTISGLLQKD